MRNSRKFILGLFFAFLSIPLFAQSNEQARKFDGLALTPPMGWNSWNKFACNVDENMIRQMADAMVSSGMKDAGYTYVNIDDCWHGTRDSLGFIHPDPRRFPSGMKSLADYVHSRGLKLGLYSDAGWKTCGGRPGSRGFEFQDALTYASWGIDYLKYDWCNTDGLKAEGAYKTMAAALKRAGRPIVLSICEWGTDKPWTWGPAVGHLWRTTGDIYDCFDCIKDHGTWQSWGVMQILDKQEGLRRYAGPGQWNDPDMLEVGNGGLSENENRAHFSIWAMLAAPLIAGNDLRNMSSSTREILTNREVIAVNQDRLGIQAMKYATRDSVEIWVKPLAEKDWAVCFLNRSVGAKAVNFNWKSEIINDTLAKRILDATVYTYAIRDLWLKTDMGDTKSPVQAIIPGHDVKMIRLSGKK